MGVKWCGLCFAIFEICMATYPAGYDLDWHVPNDPEACRVFAPTLI